MCAIERVPRTQGEYVVLQQDPLLIVERAKDVVAAMIKRLAHRNANVQLYTLEVGSNPLRVRLN
jgi:signal transducing adaptor molecule